VARIPSIAGQNWWPDMKETGRFRNSISLMSCESRWRQFGVGLYANVSVRITM